MDAFPSELAAGAAMPARFPVAAMRSLFSASAIASFWWAAALAALFLAHASTVGDASLALLALWRPGLPPGGLRRGPFSWVFRAILTTGRPPTRWVAGSRPDCAIVDRFAWRPNLPWSVPNQPNVALRQTLDTGGQRRRWSDWPGTPRDDGTREPVWRTRPGPLGRWG